MALIAEDGKGGGLKIFDRLGNFASVLGVVVVGGLITSTVKVSTGIQIASGEGVIALQDQLNNVMPCLLPVLVTAACFLILKKGKGKNSVWVILGLLVICIILSVLGILA